MVNMCKIYVSQVKAILPVWGKKEKAFVKKLHSALCDYCEDNNVNTIEELYKGYGTPQEIAFEYIALMKPEVISKRINTAKYLRILIVTVIVLSTIATSLFCMGLFHEYKVQTRQEVVGTNVVIEKS